MSPSQSGPAHNDEKDTRMSQPSYYAPPAAPQVQAPRPQLMPPMLPAPIKKVRRWPAAVIVGLACLSVGGAIGASGNSDPVAGPTATATVTATVAGPTTTVTEPAKPAATVTVTQQAPAPKAEPKAPAQAPAPPKKVTSGQENAVAKAESYLEYMAFSRKGLIAQLQYEKFSRKEATYAVDHITVSWKEQAALKGESYLESQSFSREGLYDQLKYEGFTSSQARYGVNKAF